MPSCDRGRIAALRGAALRRFDRSGSFGLRGIAKRVTHPPDAGLRRIAASHAIAVGIALATTAACTGLPFAPRPIPDCPAEIPATESIPGDFTIRESITVWAEGVNFPFELVVQKKGRELVLIGLSPMGAKLFSVVQVGIETDVDALPGAVLPIPPLNVLRDLYRLRLVGPNAPAPDLDPAVYDHADCGYSIRFERLSEEPPR